MVRNCWLGRSLKASVVFSMRSAKAPAAFEVLASWPCTVALSTKAALMTDTPALMSGICDWAKAGTHGDEAPGRVFPLGRQLAMSLFAWSIRNELRIGAASIWLAS